MHVLLLLVGLAGAVSAGCNCAKREQVRLDSQEVRINRLTAQIQHLEDDIEERLSHTGHDHDILAALDSRLNAFQGDGCGEGRFKCGGRDPQCIDNLQVCDRANDCRNGHDEDEAVCTNQAASGARFVGAPVRDACTSRQPYELTVLVTDTSVTSWYPGRVNVHASIITRTLDGHSSTTANLPTDGYYNFATGHLILFPPESDGLGMIVDFNTGDHNVANGYVTRQSNLDRCALFVLRRQ